MSPSSTPWRELIYLSAMKRRPPPGLSALPKAGTSTWWPIPYLRSFYFLGKIHENRGEMDEARQYYRRFFEYWKDGDMDHGRLDEVRAILR